MKQFEIPYNFDKQLINMLYNIDTTGELYHSIYIPPFSEDYDSAKKFYQHKEENTNMKTLQLMSRDEYESHINYIKQYFPTKIMLLLQQNNMCLNIKLLQYYISLGFSKFCVGNIEQAQQIRKILPTSEIIGSITMKIAPQDLEKTQYEIFDGFVLWFPYNRKISIIKQLPKKYKYILLVNCDCSVHCSGTHHWFANEKTEQNIQCPNKYYKFNWADIIRIEPKDLNIFEPYITYFKLQGREFTTQHIISDIYFYTIDYSYLDLKLDESKYENNNIDFSKKI